MKNMFLVRLMSLSFLTATVICTTQISAVASEDLKKEAVIFVSPSGSDDADGTKERPYGSLEEARDAVRALDRSLYDGITVYLRGGRYYQAETFVLSSEDSGSKECPITYRSYEDEEAVIDGAIVLEGDRFYHPSEEDAVASRISSEIRDRIVAYDLGSAGVDYEADGFAVYYGDERATLARYPNEQYILSFNEIASDGEVDPDKLAGSDGSFYDKEHRIKNWASIDGARIQGMFAIDWAQSEASDIISYDAETERVTVTDKSINGQSGRYYYENVVEELDIVGEYYVDEESGILYFYAPENYKDIKITASHCPDENVRQSFKRYNDTYGVSYSIIDATVDFYTFEGITVEGGYVDNFNLTGDNNVVRDCTIRCCGKSGLNVDGMNLLIEGNEIYRTGYGGMNIRSGSAKKMITSETVVTNNRIHSFGDTARVYCGAIFVEGFGIEISHNELYDGPHTALQNAVCDMIFEYNYIHDVCYEAGDAGAIYDGTWSSNGNIYRYNVFENIVNESSIYYTPHAYYSDAGGGGKNVFSNIFVNVDGYGVYCGGRDIKILDNIFINTSVHYDQCTYYPGMGLWSGYSLTAAFPIGPTGYNNEGLNWKMYLLNPNHRYGTAYGSEQWAIQYSYTALLKTTNVMDPEDNFVPYAFGDSRIRNNIFCSAKPTEIFNNVERLSVIRDNYYMPLDEIGFEDFDGGNYGIDFDKTEIFRYVPGFKAWDISLVGVL